MVYLSILGADPASANACLASRGRAEAILRGGSVPVLTLQVPMVLGEGDFASRALARRAGRPVNFLLRGSSLEQPIYAGDVVRAIQSGLAMPLDAAQTLELAGRDSLSRRELTHRAAAALGRQTRVVSIPLPLGKFVAGALELFSGDPPVTRAMLGVLDHDDHIDPAPAVGTLGLTLTPLDEVLRRCLS
jgi:uncharacterized protein YbjT (DUF2867 family)